MLLFFQLNPDNNNIIKSVNCFLQRHDCHDFIEPLINLTFNKSNCLYLNH